MAKKKKQKKVKVLAHKVVSNTVMENDNGDMYAVRLTIEAERVTHEGGEYRPVPHDPQDEGLTMSDVLDIGSAAMIRLLSRTMGRRPLS